MASVSTPQAPYSGPLAINVTDSAPTRTTETDGCHNIDHALYGYSPASVKIMLVDDEPINTNLLKIYLSEAGYENFITIADSREAMETVRHERPDVILLDLMMPHVDGFDILKALRGDKELGRIPVIILTAVGGAEAKLKALELGVNEFLAKPVDESELLLRLRNTLAAKALQDHLAEHSLKLEKQVQLRTAELLASRQEAMNCLARAAEYRDDDTGQHVIRVGRYAAIIARKLGYDKKRIDMLETAAQLHDVGKIGIPDSILLKPGKLDPIEFETMKNHCSYGTKIIRPTTDEEWRAMRSHTELGAAIIGVPTSPIMKLAAVIAETHHEKWDGSGYPRGLAGEAIPMVGRITAVADVFDALSSRRPYKEAFPREKCFAILEERRGRHFDPRVLDAFFASTKEILAVQAELADA